MIAPVASEAATPVCERLGLVFATDWPLMVCPGETAADFPVDDVEIRKLQTESDYDGMVEVPESAYQMPGASVRRAMPLRLVQSPSLDIYIERRGDSSSIKTFTFILTTWWLNHLPISIAYSICKIKDCIPACRVKRWIRYIIVSSR